MKLMLCFIFFLLLDDPSHYLSNLWKLPRLDVSTEPLSYRAVKWILARDFPVPLLNRITPKRLQYVCILLLVVFFIHLADLFSCNFFLDT